MWAHIWGREFISVVLDLWPQTKCVYWASRMVLLEIKRFSDCTYFKWKMDIRKIKAKLVQLAFEQDLTWKCTTEWKDIFLRGSVTELAVCNCFKGKPCSFTLMPALPFLTIMQNIESFWGISEQGQRHGWAWTSTGPTRLRPGPSNHCGLNYFKYQHQRKMYIWFVKNIVYSFKS